MNVSCWIYPAAVCISPPIGTSQADPKLPSKVLNGSHRIPFNPQVLGSRHCALG